MSSHSRVALVAGSLGLGGATTFLCNLSGAFVRRGIAVQVFCFEKDNPFESDFRNLHVPVVCYDESKQILEDRTEAILKSLADFKPSVVLANIGPVSFEILRYVPDGVFRIGLAHTDDPGVYRMIRFYAQCLDAIAAVSKRIAETLAAMPEFGKVSIKHLPLGVPMPMGNQRSPVADDAPLRILYLGRLGHEQKRVRLFPQILEHIRSSGIPFHWTIAGEGPDSIFLENSMRTSSPQQKISFPGKIGYTDVPELLSKHDVFLLASDYEGLPLTLLEAMGAGLVPVVSDLPSGIREVVNEDTGFRVTTTDIPGYARAIIWLHHNRESLRKLSENAHERVIQEFSTEAMANRWLAAFPQRSEPAASWPRNWQIKPPLIAANLLRFSPAGRMLRRLRRLKFALRS